MSTPSTTHLRNILNFLYHRPEGPPRDLPGADRTNREELHHHQPPYPTGNYPFPGQGM